MSRGFSNTIRPQSVSQCSRRGATKYSTNKLAAEIDVNFIFQRRKGGDGGMGATSEKCRCCFLYRNAPKIENFYIRIRKNRSELWVENLFVLYHDKTSSHRADSTQKFKENNMWLMPHPLYSPDLGLCDFFIFLKLKRTLKRQHLWDLEGNKIENGRLLPNLTSKSVMMIGSCVYGSV